MGRGEIRKRKWDNRWIVGEKIKRRRDKGKEMKGEEVLKWGKKGIVGWKKEWKKKGGSGEIRELSIEKIKREEKKVGKSIGERRMKRGEYIGEVMIGERKKLGWGMEEGGFKEGEGKIKKWLEFKRERKGKKIMVEM